MSLLPKKYTHIVPLTPGKNATVYRARNSFLDRDVFLKIYDVPENDPNSALREPQLLQSLAHAHLARIYSADALTDGRLLLEMELIGGGSIQGLLTQAGQSQTWPRISHAFDLVVDTAHGLAELHARDLVHRDIKPANIMIRNVTGGDRAVVTDLGLASALSASGRAFSSRHARVYRPPEVWSGNGYSKASDVYQLGIVLYQLLGGFVPYEKGNLDDDELAELTTTGQLLDLTSVGPHVDRALRLFLGKCICPEPQRIPTIPDFLGTIQPIEKNLLDWDYVIGPDGFTMTRTTGDRTYTVSVASNGKKHTVNGVRAIAGHAPRRFFKDQTITHADLGRCQKFRELVRAT